MRPLGWLDLDAGVRCVVGRSAVMQIDMADAIIRRADAADRYRKRTGRRHRTFGDGSIGAAAQGFAMVPVSSRIDAAYLRALAVVIERIQTRRAH